MACEPPTAFCPVFPAWLGQVRQQTSYAPRHSRQDAGGRTRLPSRRRARLSACGELTPACHGKEYIARKTEHFIVPKNFGTAC